MDRNTRKRGAAAQQQALQWLQEGVSAAECARRLGVSRQTLGRWRKEADGPDAPPAKRGRKPLLQPDQRRAALALLGEPPARHGFPEGGWTRTRVQIVLQRHFGVHLSLASISGLTAEAARLAATQAAAPAGAPDVDAIATPAPPAGATAPNDQGLFLAWANGSRDAVALYDAALRPLYANPARLAAVQSSFDALRHSSLRDSPLWSGRLPKAYVAAVLRVAGTGVSERLEIHEGPPGSAAVELSVLAQREPGGPLRGIATVLRRETRCAAEARSAAAA